MDFGLGPGSSDGLHVFILIGKMLKPLATPLGLSYLLWIAGALMYWRGSRIWGRRCVVVGVAVLMIFSNLLVGDAMIESLENDYEILRAEDSPEAEAIVVLGGATFPPIPPRVAVEVGSAFDRLLHGMRLLRSGRAPIMVLSGGLTVFVGSNLTESGRMRSLALEYGIPAQAIVLEEESRNTYENALYTRALLEERGIDRILLVTSAKHMPRAVAVFRTQGFEVIPAPTDVEVVSKSFHFIHLLPNLNGLFASTSAMREYASILVYWLRGWID